tara:strand:- start:3992 stop:5155 length:1164 start_codon:yes stop_codon:yes gene_type:complete
MSQNYLYHCIQPDNEPSNGIFTEFSMADFSLTFPERKLVTGSIRISANVTLVGGVANSDAAISNVFVDPKVGSHALFDQMSTTLDRVGQIENILEYNKYAKAVSQATSSHADYMKGSKVCELQAPNENWSKIVFKGVDSARTYAATTFLPTISELANFSMKPLVCLNSAVGGDGTISFRKSGVIRMSVRVARALQAMYGSSVSAAGAGSQPSISITNLRLHFSSVADDGADFPLTLSNTVSVKSTIQSTFANVSASVPAVCRSVFGTFIRADREAAGAMSNPLACETLPGWKSVQFLYNDTINNSLVSYTINDREECKKRYLRAVSSSDHSSIGKWAEKHDDGFGVGLAFDGLLDLRSQKINIQLTSNVDSGSPYIFSLFFQGVQSL